MTNPRLLTDEQDPWLKRVRAAAKEKGQCWICLKDYHEESECPTAQAHQRTDALREEHYKTHLTYDEMFEAWNHAIIPEAGWISISDAASAKTAAAMKAELDQAKELAARVERFYAERQVALRVKGQALADALWNAREAIRYTQEYVGEGLLPAITGWSWYDGIQESDAALADWNKR